MPHPVLEAAATGELPAWAEASPERRRHMERVAGLMAEWAPALGAADRATEWRAAAMLHDALRDAAAPALRRLVAPPRRGLPAGVLHGPAAAARLAGAGVDDDAVLLAVAWHTSGHPDLDRLGRALYVADHVEPGRRDATGELAALRERMPGELDAVTRDVVRARLAYLTEREMTILPETVEFWNALVADG